MPITNDLSILTKHLIYQVNNCQYVTSTQTIAQIENLLTRLKSQIANNFEVDNKTRKMVESDIRSYKDHEKILKQTLNCLGEFRKKECPEDLYFYTFVSGPDKAKDYKRLIENLPRQTKYSKKLINLLDRLIDCKAFYQIDVTEFDMETLR